MGYAGDRRNQFNDAPMQGEGLLCLNFGDKESIVIGECRVHFEKIMDHGDRSGMQEVRVIIIGPRSVPITRRKRK